MRLICVSDTHNEHSKLVVPDGDIFIHAGDYSDFGRSEENKSFLTWMAALPHKIKVLVIGNHDRFKYLTDRPGENRLQKYKETYPSIRFWLHEGAEFDGKKFYGCASFDDRYGEPIENIPHEVDVLITHCPPYGILDQTIPISAFGPVDVGVSIGCKKILDVVDNAQPRLHLFGHVHEQGGKKYRRGKTMCYNLSACDFNREFMTKSLVRGCEIIDL